MKVLHSLPVLILSASSIFLISTHFANPPAPTLYISVGGGCMLAIFALVIKYKQQKLSMSATEILVGSFLLLANIYGVYTGSLSLEWIISGWSLWLFYLLARRIKVTIGWLFMGLVLIGSAQAIYGLGQYMHWFSNMAAPNFRISGSFENPAGFASSLSVCFPFALFLLSKKKLYWKLIGGLAVILISGAIVLSQSRAGVIAILVIGGIWVIKALNIKGLNFLSNRTKIVGSIVLVIALLAGLYFLKKDSADGRLLIWQCSARMIADKPLLGHGAGGFQREYMLYQANYFRNHLTSSYAMLADIVKHPFNEFILLLVEHGLVGSFLFGLFVYWLIREYRKNKNQETFYAMLSLSGIAVFACFSYPLGYPFVRLMAVFCAAFIMQKEVAVWQLPQRITAVLKPLGLMVCVGLLVLTGKMFYNEYYWNTIAQQSLAGETRRVLPEYARLYPWMNRNGLFLYNYAAELNYIGEWKQSNELMTECSKLYNDNDVQLILADNYQQMKQYTEAEKHLKMAYDMIPNRFIPLYRLVKLYQEQGKHNQAYKLAEIITKKPEKVSSMEVISIKGEMAELLKQRDNYLLKCSNSLSKQK